MTKATRGPRMAHTVFFTLHDNSDAACEALLAGCQQYLTDHPGTVFFAAGMRAVDYARPVNDKAFDVSLHLVFENRAAHDAYQVAPRHDEFIAALKENWQEVRVFDATLAD